MSEDQTRTQTTGTPQLPGGVDEIRGSETDRAVTDSMAFGSSRYCKGESVEASSVPISGGARNDLNHGATVQGRTQESAKPVDFKTVTGSYAGDHRTPDKDTAAGSLAEAASVNKGPRSHTGQAPSIGKSGATNGAFGKNYNSQTWPEVDNGD